MIELKNKFHCARTHTHIHKIIIKIAKRVWIIDLNTNFTQKFSCLHAPRSHRLRFVLFSLKTTKLISISRRRSVSIALSYFLWVTACIIYMCVVTTMAMKLMRFWWLCIHWKQSVAVAAITPSSSCIATKIAIKPSQLNTFPAINETQQLHDQKNPNFPIHRESKKKTNNFSTPTSCGAHQHHHHHQRQQ